VVQVLLQHRPPLTFDRASVMHDVAYNCEESSTLYLLPLFLYSRSYCPMKRRNRTYYVSRLLRRHFSHSVALLLWSAILQVSTTTPPTARQWRTCVLLARLCLLLSFASMTNAVYLGLDTISCWHHFTGDVGLLVQVQELSSAEIANFETRVAS
jgi:hypothetical protein